MERIEALPCPFCGDKPKFRQSKISYCQLHGEPSQTFIVHCANHRCLVNPSVSGGDATWKGHELEERQKPVIRWNERPAEAALAAEVARYKQALEYYAARKHSDPFSGPWLSDSCDFGSIARTALGYEVETFPAPQQKQEG